jgi:hypothetical protein
VVFATSSAGDREVREAGAMVVAKFDRATRSPIDAANLRARSEREGWKIVALDLGLDPTTPAGELGIMAAVLNRDGGPSAAHGHHGRGNVEDLNTSLPESRLSHGPCPAIPPLG